MEQISPKYKLLSLRALFKVKSKEKSIVSAFFYHHNDVLEGYEVDIKYSKS